MPSVVPQPPFDRGVLLRSRVALAPNAWRHQCVVLEVVRIDRATSCVFFGKGGKTQLTRFRHRLGKRELRHRSGAQGRH